MDLNEIKLIIDQVFSKDGYKVGNFNFACPTNLSVDISKSDDSLNIAFNGDLPTVKTKKLFIPFNVGVQGLSLSEETGTIKIKNFPDIKFSYQEKSEENFGSAKNKFDSDSFSMEIDKEFKDNERRRVAHTAFKYAREWLEVASQSTDCTVQNKKKLISQCEKFVHEKMTKSKDIEAKSAILTFVLIYFVLPAVINWVVKKMIEKYFN